MAKNTIKQRKKEVWLGTRVPFDIPMDPPRQLKVDVWVESSTGKLRCLDMVDAGSEVAEFSRSLLTAVQGTGQSAEPYRPGRVVVDRPELLESVESVARSHQIEALLDPEIGDYLGGLVRDLEDFMSDGPGFQYLATEDVEPEEVEAFFQQFNSFLRAAPWEDYYDSDVLTVTGLGAEPLQCSILGADGTPGLALYLDDDARELYLSGLVHDGHEAPALVALLVEPGEIGPGLAGEIALHNWPVHPGGVPTMMRVDREERPHPTAPELALMTKMLEAVTVFSYEEDVECEPLHFRLSSGEFVSVSCEDALEEDPLDVVESFQESGEIMEALVAAEVGLGMFPDYDALRYRLAELLHSNRYFERLRMLCREFRGDKSIEWLLVSALADFECGHLPSCQRTLQKAVKKDRVGVERLLRNAKHQDPFWTYFGPACQKGEFKMLLPQAGGSKKKKRRRR